MDSSCWMRRHGGLHQVLLLNGGDNRLCRGDGSGGGPAASAMMLRGVFGDDSAARQSHLSVTVFACLTLLIAPLVVFRVAPSYVFVPGLFYGLSATALLLSISPRANPTEASEPVEELPPPPDLPI